MTKKKKTILENHKVGWPAVVLLCVVFASLAMVLTFAPETVQSQVIEWLGWAGLALSQFIGPLLRRKTGDEKEERSSEGASDDNE